MQIAARGGSLFASYSTFPQAGSCATKLGVYIGVIIEKLITDRCNPGTCSAELALWVDYEPDYSCVAAAREADDGRPDCGHFLGSGGLWASCIHDGFSAPFCSLVHGPTDVRNT